MTGSRPEAADAPPEELVRRSSGGDLAAFARIVRLYHADMTRVAFVITGDLEAAAGATGAAWPVAWYELRDAPMPDGLGPWLCALAATEAIVAARSDGAPGAATSTRPAGPARHHADDDLARALARLDPADRALLALRYVAGVSMAELARTDRRPRSPVAERLERLTAEIDGSPPPGSDPSMADAGAEQRLLAYAAVPVRPVDADAAARAARAREGMERTRLVSIAVSAVLSGLVLWFPYLVVLIHGR